MATKKKLLEAAAGSAGGAGGLDVNEVFSTYLYTGNSSTQTITNGIDLAGEGGLVWIKSRSGAQDNHVFDTERGATFQLRTNTTVASSSDGDTVTQFNSDGFIIDDDPEINASSVTYASWTFRKAPKFFDVVTYTGNGVAGRTVSHNLGTTVGALIIKRMDTTGEWIVYHKDISSINNVLFLNSTSGEFAYSSFNSTAPTSTEFTLGTRADVNASGGTYVAYLFAHNDGDGEFGPTGDQDIIKCGSYTGNSTIGHTINLGFEAQWVLVRSTSNLRKWMLYDAMRGMPVDGNGAALYPNSTDAEEVLTRIGASNVGFQLTSTDSMVNVSGETYIYIAIRRGPMAVPESATDVFTTVLATDDAVELTSGFPVDLFLQAKRSIPYTAAFDRVRGSGKRLYTYATSAESAAGADIIQFDSSTSFQPAMFGSTTSMVHWAWKRAPSFFDVVCYTGNGVAGRTVSHNLGVAPEMMWIKRRDAISSAGWAVYHSAISPSGQIFLNSSGGYGLSGSALWNSTAPTDSVFSLGTYTDVNNASGTYIAYLFASLAGVSKVGSYTGNGTSQNIDCGFSNGARFVLIKRTNGTGNWLVFDTARGIVAGNDYLLRLNLTDAESSDYDQIDPLSSGFTVVRGGQAEIDVNYSGYEYIYYAIA